MAAAKISVECTFNSMENKNDTRILDSSSSDPESQLNKENVQNENTGLENPNEDEASTFSENVTYNDAMEAIYTDPVTHLKYKWNESTSEWQPLTVKGTEIASNPYENDYYYWCQKTNQWLPKFRGSGESGENSFYKWNPERKEWRRNEQNAACLYNSTDGSYTYKDPDGTVFFWDSERNAWFPQIDDNFLASYQLNYGFNDDEKAETSQTQTEACKITANNLKLKRKLKPEPQWFDLPDEQNTKVYVDNLPLDMTQEEFVELMSKCGLIMKDPKTQKFKVKLYCDSNGQFKGDGLCDYIKVESVELAVNLLNGYDVMGKHILVQRAKFKMRGNYNPALKPKMNKKEKEKLVKLKERLFDWRPEKMRGERSKHERVLILKNLFSPEVFTKDFGLILEYKNDLQEECTKCGTVRKVIIFDHHSEGVAQITMSSPEEADTVVQMMNGRFYGKRKLVAEIWDGKTKYKVAETIIENEQRLKEWSEFLISGEQSDKQESKSLEHAADHISSNQ